MFKQQPDQVTWIAFHHSREFIELGVVQFLRRHFFRGSKWMGKQMRHKYWHVSATGDRHWTFLTTPDHAIYVNLLIATNNDLRRARSLIHCRHFCIHWSQAESFHELLFENSFFLLFDLNPSWNYTFHFSSFLEFFYCTCHFFLHFLKYLFYLFFLINLFSRIFFKILSFISCLFLKTCSLFRDKIFSTRLRGNSINHDVYESTGNQTLNIDIIFCLKFNSVSNIGAHSLSTFYVV